MLQMVGMKCDQNACILPCRRQTLLKHMTNTPNHDMLKHHDIRTATALLHWQAGTADTGQNKPLGRGLEAALNASEHVQGEVLAHLQVQRCSVLRQHTTAVLALSIHVSRSDGICCTPETTTWTVLHIQLCAGVLRALLHSS